MSKQLHITPNENWDQYLTDKQPSLLNRFGRKLGSLFLSTKNAAKHKYIEITQGINSRIEEESQMIWAEAQEQLFEQAQDYERTIKRTKLRWLAISLATLVIGAIAGVVTAVLYIL